MGSLAGDDGFKVWVVRSLDFLPFVDNSFFFVVVVSVLFSVDRVRQRVHQATIAWFFCNIITIMDRT